MRDSPLWRLADQPRILCERARPMPWRPWFPGLPASRKLGLVDEEIHAACGSVNPDAVAVAHQCQCSTDESFR